MRPPEQRHEAAGKRQGAGEAPQGCIGGAGTGMGGRQWRRCRGAAMGQGRRWGAGVAGRGRRGSIALEYVGGRGRERYRVERLDIVA